MGKSTVDASAGFGLRDKLAYAAGDFGCNMSFALKGYLTIYWTQFMGIDNYLMASLLLIVQIWDAINDPIIGAMVDADTHKYRRNKFLERKVDSCARWIGSSEIRDSIEPYGTFATV